jgi:hypothetical protein
MKRSSLLLLGAVLLFGACAKETPQASDPAATYDTFGTTFEPQDAVPIQAVVAEPAPYVGQTVKVEGVVREVCQQAGCWFTLDAGTARPVRIRVARKEDGSYAFTMPKDVSGRRVVVQGTLAEATLSAEEQQHLAEDGQAAHENGDAGSATPAAPTDSTLQAQSEYQLTASGVLVEKART